MAKPKRNRKSPQAKHKQKGKPSQFDKRKRLLHGNPDRKKTHFAKVPLVGTLAQFVASLAVYLDKRVAFRLGIIMAGMILSDDRRTASAWFAMAGVRDDWDRFYDALNYLGRKTELIAWSLVALIFRVLKIDPHERITIAIDDSPTRRFGRHVQGAGVHHNPTSGPAEGEFLYGHNWVSLAMLRTRPLLGVIALPIRSMLYVRQIDVPKLPAKLDWKFQTKHQLALQLIHWFVGTVRRLGFTGPIVVAMDGAYAAKDLLKPVIEMMGVTVVSRLRRDAKLCDLPAARQPGQRGRTRVYGTKTVSLAKRAGSRQGWTTISYRCRGKTVTRQVKSFQATSRLTSGVIQVVLVRFEDGGWAAYFSTDANMEPKQLLESVADRWSIEEAFHDVKEIWGAGEQQIRNVHSSVGCWHLNNWMFTLVELSSWDRNQALLVDRSDRPWDNAERRASHNDRKRSIAREMLEKQFITSLPKATKFDKYRERISEVIALCT
jgi:hypothetical protein